MKIIQDLNLKKEDLIEILKKWRKLTKKVKNKKKVKTEAEVEEDKLRSRKRNFNKRLVIKNQNSPVSLRSKRNQ